MTGGRLMFEHVETKSLPRCEVGRNIYSSLFGFRLRTKIIEQLVVIATMEPASQSWPFIPSLNANQMHITTIPTPKSIPRILTKALAFKARISFLCLWFCSFSAIDKMRSGAFGSTSPYALNSCAGGRGPL